MQVLVNKDGSRNRQFRPYIDQEELYRNVPLYDPNGLKPLSRTGVLHGVAGAVDFDAQGASLGLLILNQLSVHLQVT